MTIFISYSQKDQPIVAHMAEVIKTTFGQANVFFDQWSIQPGDSIIQAMNKGLANCNFFLFFISKNSLSSGMVNLEWMNALMKQTKGVTKFIPIKMDDCLIPTILLQNMYINLYGHGLDCALRQIIDVVLVLILIGLTIIVVSRMSERIFLDLRKSIKLSFVQKPTLNHIH